MEQKEEKARYDPPEIVVCQANVELGFAGSEDDGTVTAPEWEVIH